MSFILDALKKSENERQRQIGPSLADIAPRAKRQGERPWWAVLVAALLVINLSVLIVVLTRDDADAQVEPGGSNAAPAARAQTAAPEQRAQTSAADVATSPAVRSLADEVVGSANSAGAESPERTHLAAAAAVPAGPPIVRPIDPPAVAPLPATPPAAAQPASGHLPTLQDLIASGTSLPELHLDLHVDQGSPSFVMVNMRKYLEGQTLSEGPVVERINSEGVVLNHRGQRFLLPKN
jgi:general secretion pathway protein B